MFIASAPDPIKLFSSLTKNFSKLFNKKYYGNRDGYLGFKDLGTLLTTTHLKLSNNIRSSMLIK